MSMPTGSAEPHPESEAALRGPSRRGVAVAVSLILIGLAVAVLWDSYGRGAGWDGGPQSGFFPARVGWLFLAGSLFLLVQSFREPQEVFVTWGQLALVARVFVPLAIFVALIEPLGVYVSAALFILIFMVVIGGARWYAIALTAALVPAVAFWVFEMQFLVPLPKGPVEALFGY